MNLTHWLAISHIPYLGGATLRRLLDRFGSIEAVFAADAEELAAVPRLRQETVDAIQTLSLAEIEAELAEIVEAGINLLAWDHPEYPRGVHDLPDPPPLLFVQGCLESADQHGVAIVGGRNASANSMVAARRLARGLAERGLTVVSGLALGIDTAAHQGALESSVGRTVAVLGSGFERIHPKTNRQLARRIVDRGALVTECLPTTPPRSALLMARDRIIAALGRAVIVVEAEEKSGSLDTARRARRLGRRVLACPGSPGTDSLLKAGAERLDAGAEDLDALVERLQQDPKPQRLGEQGRLF